MYKYWTLIAGVLLPFAEMRADAVWGKMGNAGISGNGGITTITAAAKNSGANMRVNGRKNAWQKITFEAKGEGKIGVVFWGKYTTGTQTFRLHEEWQKIELDYFFQTPAALGLFSLEKGGSAFMVRNVKNSPAGFAPPAVKHVPAKWLEAEDFPGSSKEIATVPDASGKTVLTGYLYYNLIQIPAVTAGKNLHVYLRFRMAKGSAATVSLVTGKQPVSRTKLAGTGNWEFAAFPVIPAEAARKGLAVHFDSAPKQGCQVDGFILSPAQLSKPASLIPAPTKKSTGKVKCLLDSQTPVHLFAYVDGIPAKLLPQGCGLKKNGKRFTLAYVLPTPGPDAVFAEFTAKIPAADKIQMDLTGDGSGHGFFVILTDVSGESFYAELCRLTWKGKRHFSFAVSRYIKPAKNGEHLDNRWGGNENQKIDLPLQKIAFGINDQPDKAKGKGAVTLENITIENL